MKYLINNELHFLKIQDSKKTESWLCTLESEDNREFRFVIPINTYKLIIQFSTPSSLLDIKKKKENEKITDLEWEQFNRFIVCTLIPKGIFLTEKDNFRKPKLIKGKPKHMAFQIRILKKNITRIITKPLTPFFKKSVSISLLIFSALSQVLFYTSSRDIASDINSIQAIEQIQTIIIVGLGLLIHELGHATAAAKYNCKNVELGIGWYVVFIVFYAELSESWKLKRNQRLIVDCGGIYFQLIFTMILTAIYLAIEKSPILYYSITMLNISFLWNLNPFFRMDGYWIACDLLDTKNLREVCNQELKKFIKKLKIGLRNKNYNYTPNIRILVYAISGNIFFCYILYAISKDVVYSSLTSTPEIISVIGEDKFFSLNYAEMLTLTSKTLFHSLLLVFSITLILKTIKSAYTFLSNNFKSAAQKQ